MLYKAIVAIFTVGGVFLLSLSEFQMGAHPHHTPIGWFIGAWVTSTAIGWVGAMAFVRER